jgi:hypothetical protein
MEPIPPSRRRLAAVACWSASNVLDAIASEVMPPKPKRVRTVKAKAIEDRPGWYDKVERS